FWEKPFVIASIHTAKTKKHSPIVTSIHYDIVIVDEAHHVRNRRTMAWELVNQIQKKFIFLLTATPVQNNLIELYNLITLLNPGQFKTEKLFKEEYVARGNLRKPLNKDKLRALLRDCMIRNTRSAIDIKLPKRYATTLRLDPTEHEKEVYTRLNHYLRTHNLKKPTINLLLREAGSSPFALKESLLKLDDKKAVAPVIEQFTDGFDIAKGKALVEILKKNPGEKKLIFTQFIKSLDYITNVLTKQGIPYVRFEGTMTTREKNEAVARFRDKVPVFVSTESGGEGRNLQFCNTIINFDLPWNPMRIEQRIGRLHRIGQTRDVFIFNLTVKNTIEDYIIDILDSKINMFEMVIGEIEPILGHIGREEDFEDIILDIWMKSATEEQVKEEFEQLGQEMMKAKKAYLKTRQLDDEIFGEDYEA
ncbi:MAG TPA: DEAD/DEAH box helicase, partial [Thermodesulfovibrionia bacterium]|nr:DEAD/DEAH box helicase [Thermodesulfovibrionia bacterium]